MGMHSGKLSSNKIINMSKKWPLASKMKELLAQRTGWYTVEP